MFSCKRSPDRSILDRFIALGLSVSSVVCPVFKSASITECCVPEDFIARQKTVYGRLSRISCSELRNDNLRFHGVVLKEICTKSPFPTSVCILDHSSRCAVIRSHFGSR